ncbi:MAG: NTP transferase domain-containing protein [Deltaproteobacteria bacterium]|nr:NTP transferase domain-containing protein [Deltaproteobacteria bacterium]
MPTQSPATWSAIILAAGEGTRMKSNRPKVLHEIAGRTLVSWVVQTALDAGAARCLVVVGHGRGDVEKELVARFGERVEMVLQPEQRGTGDAVRCAMEADRTLEGRLVVLYGDCPLIPVELLHDLVDASDRAGAGLGLVTATLEDPSGYGRIVRNRAGDVQRIVEDRDCSDVERGVQEVNPGLYAVQADFLRKAIAQVTPDNAQGQLYLTDVVELAANGGKVVDLGGDMADLTGVNDSTPCTSTRNARWSLAQRWVRTCICAGDAWSGPAPTSMSAACSPTLLWRKTRRCCHTRSPQTRRSVKVLKSARSATCVRKRTSVRAAKSGTFLKRRKRRSAKARR